MNYAGFWRRFVAVVIDGLILTIPALAFGPIFPVGAFIFALAYKPVFDASPIKGTPGKILMGMAVVSEAGERITLKQAFIRFLSSFLSSIMMIGYLLALFTERKQTLHDLIAETVVVNETAPEVNFFSVWWSEIQRIFGALENAPAVGPTGSKKTSDASLETLEQLHKLYQSGALTEQEYLTKKEEILKRI